MKRDAVQQILQIVGSVANVDRQTLARADSAIRSELGGQAVRIQYRAPVTIEDIDDRLRQRKPVALIAVEVGLSRATVYRMLGKRTKKSRTPANGATRDRAE